MIEYIKREAVIQVLQGIANGLSVGETEALKAKDIKSLLKIKAAKEILETVDNDVCFIPNAEVQPVDRWISVKDRLPDDGERIIVYTVEGNVLEMKFDKRRESWCRLDIDGMEWFGKSFVTHWQPLPEPPKEESS